MFKKKWMASISVMFVVVCLGAKTPVQRYAPGPPPSIGDIQSMCVEEYPGPRSRTSVGIGEMVTCWIDPKTWHDTDILTEAKGKQTEVADALGLIVWSVNGRGTVCPIVTHGSAVTLTAGFVGYDDTATVIATVRDSGTMGEDAPIERQKEFQVIVPAGIGILQSGDHPPAEKAGAGK